ncbi:MAG: hypothetical protein EOO14_20450 [Chitinophagaceae bacterium]|nr:MAG: hypothetical protein EOO14_20450 [Chitinophagaceae bacterium]
MTKKKENKNPKPSSSPPRKDDERRLLEEHPYETMSQIQNRYGNGRARNGSEGSEKGANRLDH